METRLLVIIAAALFTFSVLSLGYLAFGFWTAFIFTSGFAGGFALWLLNPHRGPYAALRRPYFLTLALFILHRVEEKLFGFFRALSSLTGVETPPVFSWQVILLVLASVGAWLLIPPLVSRGYAFGYYLAWTFFAAMGITELAHFIFPIIAGGPYGYFPGMATVLLLAPAGWWGMRNLARAPTVTVTSRSS